MDGSEKPDGSENTERVVAQKKLLSALNALPPLPDVWKHINVFHAKIVAVCFVVGFIAYHTALLATLGTDSCKYLLSDGRFQGANWQPFGCMMHLYSNSDARSCMHYISYWKGRNHVVFIGDSKMKELYHEYIATVDEAHSEHQSDDIHFMDRKSFMYSNATQELYSPDHEHYEQSSIGLYVEFRYFEYLNSDYIDQLSKYRSTESSQRPTVIVTSVPLCNCPDIQANNETESVWKKSLDSLAGILDTLQSGDTDVVWYLQDPRFSNQHSNETKALNQVIDTHNRAVISRFESSKINLWKSSRLIAQIFQKNATWLNETIHSQLDIQIFLNYKCNDDMYYQDGTCCTKTEKPTVLQFLAAVLFMISLGTSIIMFFTCRRKIRASRTTSVSEETEEDEKYTLRKLSPPFTVTAYELVKGFSKLGLIVAYVYLCDRTTLFMKENKNYAHYNFVFPLGYVLLIGLIFAKDSKESHILHRDQTDEWKGWMQLVILIYHFTGASQVLPIYMVVRCLVTSYVFLNAYGNFMYSWTTGDYSMHRFFSVIVRYNLLVVCLCVVMNRPYQFYYFVPLITFWYTIMFVLSALWPRVHAKTAKKRMWILIVKLVILTSLVTLLYNFEVVFEKIFIVHPIKSLFVTKDNTIHEWKFRWSLDRYSSIFGVLFGLFVVMAKQYNILSDKDNLSGLFKSDSVMVLSSFFSAAGLVGYAVMVITCESKEQCNKLHSYMSFIPIISYVFIRNALGPVRTLYSQFFAWFGKFALELFVAQYHIWLAADTQGILVLVPNFPIINVFVTTFIFIFAAHELHAITERLTMYLVPSDWKYLLRNVFLFIALMIPVAFYSGSFNV